MEHLHNTTFIKQIQDERDSLPLWTPPCCAHPRPTFLLSQQSYFETATDMDGHLYTGDTYVEPHHPISPVEQILFFDEFSNHHHIFGTGTTLLLIMIIVLLCCCLPSLHSSCSTCLPTVCTHPVENWKDKRSLKRTQELNVIFLFCLYVSLTCLNYAHVTEIKLYVYFLKSAVIWKRYSLTKHNW